MSVPDIAYVRGRIRYIRSSMCYVSTGHGVYGSVGGYPACTSTAHPEASLRLKSCSVAQGCGGASKDGRTGRWEE
eukprot:3932319-Rhodomonas_salina.2